MKKILITGASGFIGRRILPLLESKGFEIYSLQRTPVPSTNTHSAVVCDLSDEKRVEEVIREIKPSHLLHLAWYTEHGKFWDSLENIDWIRKSLFLVRTFAQYGGKRAVIAGSCAEYSWDTEILSEDSNSYLPSSLYGKAKNFLRILLEELAKEKNISLAWARIFFLYGADEPKGKIVASMLDQFMKDQTFTLKNGQLYRDFLHVEDVADAFVHILDSSIEGQINIASGEATSLLTIGKTLHSLIGKGNLVVSDEELQTANIPKILIADVDKLKHTLKWVPKFSIDTGLSNIVQSWTRNH